MDEHVNEHMDDVVDGSAAAASDASTDDAALHAPVMSVSAGSSADETSEDSPAAEPAPKSQTRTYTGPDSAPSDEEGRIATVGFDGVEVRVVPSNNGETYFSVDPPNAQPTLHAATQLSNREILEFVRANLSQLRDMRTDMLRRYEKSQSAACRYRTGEVAYLFGRPFMLRVLPLMKGGSMRKAARGRANTWVRTNTDLSLVELNVMNTGNYDQRKGTFVNWASSVLGRNAASIYDQIARRIEQAYGQELPSKLRIRNVRVAGLRGRMARIDTGTATLMLSEDLIPFPPVVLAYTLAREIAGVLVEEAPVSGEATATDAETPSAEELAAERNRLVAAGCPEWEEARAMLGDPDSIYRRQL